MSDYRASRFARRALSQMRALYEVDPTSARAAQAVIISSSPDVLVDVAEEMRSQPTVEHVVVHRGTLRVVRSATIHAHVLTLPQLAVNWVAPDSAVRQSLRRPTVLLWVAVPAVDPNLFSTLVDHVPSSLEPSTALMFEGRDTRWWNDMHPPRGARTARVWRETAARIASGSSVSTHSASAHTLPLLIAELERLRVPYVIEARPGEGYVVRGAAK